MKTTNDLQPLVIFLGIAGHVEPPEAAYPASTIDIFQLAQYKSHIVYPGIISGDRWIFLVRTDLLKGNLDKLALRIIDENGLELASTRFSKKQETIIPERQIIPSGQIQEGFHLPILKDSPFTMLHFRVGDSINHPGRYSIQSIYENSTVEIGAVNFNYKQAPTLTPDQIKAIESDPNSVKEVHMELGCKFCPTELKVYTGLKRRHNLEKNGWKWQTDLPDEFKCQCGKTQYSLKYLKESMHGMLLKYSNKEITGLSYVRQYGHSQVVRIVEEFTAILIEKAWSNLPKSLSRNIRCFYHASMQSDSL